jgi:type IV secretory pathway VirB2 component (pilin)
MSTEATPAPVERPRTVDYALYAMVARCVFALLSALALFAARDEISTTARQNNPDWSAATVDQKVSSIMRTNLIETVIIIAIVLMLAKLIRDGRSWSRWVYSIISFIPLGDAFKVTSFFSSGSLLLRLPYGLTGVATLVAISMLFVRPSSPYFRKPAVDGVVRVSPFAALFRPRPRRGAAAGGAPVTPVVSEPAGKRNAPRSKSRKASTE